MVRIRIGPLALPLGELSPQATERAFAVTVYPLRLRCAQPPLPKGETSGCLKEIFGAYLPIHAGKTQENRSGFLGRFKEVRREIEIPPGSFSFASVFFWRSKRKCWTAVANLQKTISLLPGGSLGFTPSAPASPNRSGCYAHAAGRSRWCPRRGPAAAVRP